MNRPQLVLDNKPNILFKFGGNQKFAIKDLISGSGDTLLLKSTITCKFIFNIKNIGNSIANVYMYALVDTNTGSYLLREDLMSDSISMSLIDDSLYYYHSLEIFPDELHTFEIQEELKGISNSNFTVHFYLVYSNEFDNIYDSYYISRFKTNDIIWGMRHFIQDNKLYLQMEKVEQDKPFIETIDDHLSSKIFTEEEVNKFLEKWDEFWANYQKTMNHKE